LREVYFEGPNRTCRALKTSILSTGSDRSIQSASRSEWLAFVLSGESGWSLVDQICSKHLHVETCLSTGAHHHYPYLTDYLRGWSTAIRRIRSVSNQGVTFLLKTTTLIHKRNLCHRGRIIVNLFFNLLFSSEANKKVLQASKPTHNFKCQICKIVNELPQEAIYLLQHIVSQRRNRCDCMLLSSHESVQIQSGTGRISYNSHVNWSNTFIGTISLLEHCSRT